MSAKKGIEHTWLDEMLEAGAFEDFPESEPPEIYPGDEPLIIGKTFEEEIDTLNPENWEEWIP